MDLCFRVSLPFAEAARIVSTCLIPID